MILLKKSTLTFNIYGKRKIISLQLIQYHKKKDIKRKNKDIIDVDK